MAPKKTTSTKTKTVGSRVQVLNGTAQRTAGGLTKNDLMLNKWGRIVSKKRYEAAMKRWKSVEEIFKKNQAPRFKKK